MWLPHSPFVYSRINKNGEKPKIKVMMSKEFFKVGQEIDFQGEKCVITRIKEDNTEAYFQYPLAGGSHSIEMTILNEIK